MAIFVTLPVKTRESLLQKSLSRLGIFYHCATNAYNQKLGRYVSYFTVSLSNSPKTHFFCVICSSVTFRSQFKKTVFSLLEQLKPHYICWLKAYLCVNFVHHSARQRTAYIEMEQYHWNWGGSKHVISQSIRKEAATWRLNDEMVRNNKHPHDVSCQGQLDKQKN